MSLLLLWNGGVNVIPPPPVLQAEAGPGGGKPRKRRQRDPLRVRRPVRDPVFRLQPSEPPPTTTVPLPDAPAPLPDVTAPVPGVVVATTPFLPRVVVRARPAAPVAVDWTAALAALAAPVPTPTVDWQPWHTDDEDALVALLDD